MSFSTPWTVTREGKELGPCRLIANLVEDEERPSARTPKDQGWAISAIKVSLRNVTDEQRDAIIESVVAVWRLRERDEEGPADGAWQAHLAAWLVRGLFDFVFARDF